MFARRLFIGLIPLILVANLSAHAQEAETTEKDLVGKALAGAAYVTMSVSTAGLLFVYHDVDKVVGQRYKTLVKEMKGTELAVNFLQTHASIQELRKKIENLKRNFRGDPIDAATLKHLKYEMDSYLEIRRIFASQTLDSIVRAADKMTVEEAARLARIKEKAMRRFAARMERGYARTNPIYVVTLGAAVLAVVATTTDLRDMEFTEVYAMLSPADQDTAAELLANEMSDDSQNLDDLLAHP